MDLELPDDMPALPSPDELRVLQQQLHARPAEFGGGPGSAERPLQPAAGSRSRQAWHSGAGSPLSGFEATHVQYSSPQEVPRPYGEDSLSSSLFTHPMDPQHPEHFERFPPLEWEEEQKLPAAHFLTLPSLAASTPKQLAKPLPTMFTLPETYPAAECSQHEVLQDRNVFFMALQMLHEAMGITEKVPRVGGRELDLHLLYCNVCSLGGCEHVTACKLWREAAEPFRFPETITSVSYILRKAYIGLLWDFEQVYLHNKSGQRIAAPPPSLRDFTTPSTVEPPTPTLGSRRLKRRRTSDCYVQPSPGHMASTPTQMVAAARHSAGPNKVAVGAQGAVTVDSRFDAGYFVTVQMGRQEFQGMLYYPPLQHAQAEQRAENSEPEKAEDSASPKPNKTPFNFFSVDARAQAKEAFPELSQTEITKKVGEMWQKTSDAEKAPYVSISNQDKHRYQAELNAYNYRLAAHAASETAGRAMHAVATAQRAVSQHSRSLSSRTAPIDVHSDPATSQDLSR